MMQARKAHSPQILGHNPVVGMRFGGMNMETLLVFPVFFFQGLPHLEGWLPPLVA